MGDIQTTEAHVKRSSGKSFAVRWKRDFIRKTALFTTIVGLAAVLFATLLYGASFKRVTLVVDGQESAVETAEADVAGLLEARGIDVKPHDRLSVPLSTDLNDGDRIVLERTTPVTVTADGQTITAYTVGKTVSEALKDLDIAVNEHDKVSPDPAAAITANAEIKVTRVTKETAELKESVPFGVVKRTDANLPKGKEKVVQEGKAGELVKTVEKVYEDGVLVAEQVVAETKTAEPVDKVVAVGTKNPVTTLSNSSSEANVVSKNGVTFGYQRVLNNVTLTAYSNDDASTSGGKWDGITASGTKTVEGRTIAVDPNVIPLGWWVYIEGIGFRRAEDTGGAIKGNKIDVFFNSSDYARRFGIKRGYKVYIIGKEKPAVSN